MTDGAIGEMVGGRSPLVAYFSMEIGLDPAMPTYAGVWVCWLEMQFDRRPIFRFLW